MHVAALASLASLASFALLSAGAASPAAAATYAVRDLGAPAGYTLGIPTSLNATGQIAGQAMANGVSYPLYPYATCMAYDAGWIPFDGANGAGCLADGGGSISDASASGVFAVTGAKLIPTTNGLVAYYAKISRTGVTTLVYFRNVPSEFYGMNSLGYAVGTTFDAAVTAPLAQFERSAPAYSTGGSQLTLLQPSCESKTGCLAYPGAQVELPVNVTNARVVAKDGSTFGQAASGVSGQYVIVAKSGKVLYAFDLPAYQGAAVNVAGMDDAHRIVYGQVSEAFEYDPSTKKALNLGKLPGPCSYQYVPLGVNGPGDVFGYANSQPSSCSSTLYFLWTRKGGMQPISDAAPNQIYLWAMNDADDFAGYEVVSVPPSRDTIHWVILTPSTNASRLAMRHTAAPTLNVPLTIIDASAAVAGTRAFGTTSAVAGKGVMTAAGTGAPARLTARATGAKPAFSIVDVGAPPSPGGVPMGFNDTGQIVGTGVPAPTEVACYAWTGKLWLQIPAGIAAGRCEPTTGVTNADGAGSFHAVGSADTPTDEWPSAFVATIGPSKATVTLFDANSPSWLYAVNTSGEAVGSTYFNPLGGWLELGPNQAVPGNTSPVTWNGSSLSILQPACAKGQAGCMAAPLFSGGANDIYQGGKARALAGDGTILGWASDIYAGQYVEVGKTAVRQFDLPLPGDAVRDDAVVGIDDAGTVVYQQESLSGSAHVSRYDPVTGIASAVPPVPGSSCLDFFPISVNASGEILGSASNCLNGSDAAAWTWSPATGKTALITYATHGYSRVTVYWLNDKGQLLAELHPTHGPVHWGYLTP